MTRYSQAALVSAALSWLPSTVARRLGQGRSYRAKWGVEVAGTFNIGLAKIPSDSFIEAVNAVYADGGPLSVNDALGEPWEITREEVDGEYWGLRLTRGVHEYSLRPFIGFLPTGEDREDALGRLLSQRRLDTVSEKRWRDVLRQRKFTFAELEEFDEDLALTVGEVSATVEAAYQSNRATLDQLVPSAMTYYERLVGKWDGSQNIAEYAEAEWSSFLLHALSLGGSSALVDCLRLGWHSSLVNKIPAELFTEETILEVVERVSGQESIIAQVACLEFCLTNLSRWPSIEPSLVKLIESLKNERADGVSSRFRLLSALFSACEGQMAHTGAISDRPPFWRRLATLSHASLLERGLLATDINADHFSSWAANVHVLEFNLQSLCDLRLEPRWLNSMAQPRQLHSELIGRIHSAAVLANGSLPTQLRKALFRGKQSRILPDDQQLNAMMPGPLEGGSNAVVEAPDELATLVRQRLQELPVAPEALWGFVNHSLLFKADLKLAALAAESVRVTRLRLIDPSDDIADSLIQALAFLAAVTRNRPLADEVRILLRALLRLKPNSVVPFQYISLVLRMSAANEDEGDWSLRIGELFTERSFDHDYSAEEASEYLECLRWLRVAYPSLWKHLGRAIAAFEVRAMLSQ